MILDQRKKECNWLPPWSRARHNFKYDKDDLFACRYYRKAAYYLLG